MSKAPMTKRAKVEAGALVLLVFSALAVWYFAGHPVAGSARASTTVIARYMPMGVENPRIHWDRLEDAQRTQYETVGRDIFTGSLPTPPAPVLIPQLVEMDITPPPPPPPPPPHLPLKFFGYGAAQADSGSRAFLTDGATVYIVAEGDTVLGHYRVVKITRSSLEFEDIGSGRRGVSIIEDQGPTF